MEGIYWTPFVSSCHHLEFLWLVLIRPLMENVTTVFMYANTRSAQLFLSNYLSCNDINFYKITTTNLFFYIHTSNSSSYKMNCHERYRTSGTRNAEFQGRNHIAKELYMSIEHHKYKQFISHHIHPWLSRKLAEEVSYFCFKEKLTQSPRSYDSNDSIYICIYWRNTDVWKKNILSTPKDYFKKNVQLHILI